MIQRFESLSGKPFGVISIDVNGLKVVNDTQGHAAGDALLERAAKAMGGIFRSEDIYRIGGDEFLIIAIGIGEEKFAEKAEMLHSAQNDELSFAMGTYWSDGSEAVRDVIRRTDKLMYADKKAFYKHNPAKKRERRG
jgi:diguanylate cyclase (GGDEF)-like protein